MNFKVFLATLLVASCVDAKYDLKITAEEAANVLVAIGSILILKGAMTVGYLEGRRVRTTARAPRQYDGTADAAVTVLTAVEQVDSIGCTLKLICLLEARDKADRDLEENLIVESFSSYVKSPAARDKASSAQHNNTGKRTKESAAYSCEKQYPKCLLDEYQLRTILKNPREVVAMISG
ncbi:uncharacterized protein [Palaemon carinicauda]|uniref:uncharacterized protein n=1 Tax=Palaemon carinicauda TaxID=392227 RepID=UPI0035B5BE74